MSDNRDVLRGIQRKTGVVYSALTPNLKGFQDAVKINNMSHDI